LRIDVRIQINSDKNIAVDAQVIGFVETEINRVLTRFIGKLTRVEVHLSDVNSDKFGEYDKRCLLPPAIGRRQWSKLSGALSENCGVLSRPFSAGWGKRLGRPFGSERASKRLPPLPMLLRPRKDLRSQQKSA
jgi:hypothetical protein